MKCSISECKKDATKTVEISFRESRNLCKNHYELFKNKDRKYLANFIKAKKLQHI